MNRRWIFRLLAAGIPTALGLAILTLVLFKQGRLVFEDGWFRFQSPPIYLQEPGYEKTGHQYLYDRELGWRNIADWRATTFGKKLTTNSKHLRDREYAYEKPEGVRRVLVLGDSFAWGYGVADDEIFTEVLEGRLEDARSPWQVINTGVSGWGTDQQYLYYRREGKDFEPDVVVLAFYIGNDPGNNVAPVQYGLNKPLFSDMDLSLSNVPVPKPGDGDRGRGSSGLNPMAITVRIMQELAKACREGGAELVIMKFGVFQLPDSEGARRVEEAFHSLVPAVTKAGGVHYLDLDAEFAKRSASVEQLTEGVDDGHWNPHGHGVVAEILHDFLAARSLVK